jgi:ankyrin repeat protein
MSSLLSSSEENISVATEHLRDAAKYGDLEAVQALFERHGHVIVNAKDDGGWTALHHASIYDKLEVIKYLIETCGANIHAVNMNGSTPLHSASRFGQLETAKYLVEAAGADACAANKEGDTPLHNACWNNGALPVVQYLVENCNVSILAANAAGRTSLHVACDRGWMETVIYLVGVLPAV